MATEQQKARVENEIIEMDRMIVSTLTIYIIVALAAALLAVVIVVITAIRITRALAKGVRFAN